MSTAAKWLLITLLAIVVHAIYVMSIGVGLEPGSVSFVFPFGGITASNAASFAWVEALLACIILIGFAVALLRNERM